MKALKRRRTRARPAPYARRRDRVRGKFRAAGIDALLVTGTENVRYLTGFTGDESALLVTGSQALLLTDARYTTQAREEVRGVEVWCRRTALMPFAAEVARRAGVRRLGVESARLALAEYRALERAMRGTQMVETTGLVEALRERKAPAEVAEIEAAVRIAETAFQQVRPQVRPGVTERALATALECALMEAGAEGAAFRPIVLVQERAALPHGRPTERRLAEGEAVLFDWGARRNGYVSDLTRVLFVHRIPGRYRRIYEAVLDAQAAALRAIRPGASVGDADRAARRSLKRHRRAKYFTHSLGHGVGMEVHEAPAVSEKSRTVLRAGMVFTVEPGVYYPGRIGVRIEDMVVVGRGGYRLLSRLPKRPDDVVVRAS